MTSIALHTQAKRFLKAVPEIRTGFTVRVHERIQEAGKERVQIFEGLVISVHKGHTAADSSFTVRKIVSGVGVEKIFPIHSPNVDKIEVKKVAKVRRAKLFFIRGRTGKAARMIERFTMSGEFGNSAVESSESTEPEVLEEEPVRENDVIEATAATETPAEETPVAEEVAAEPEAEEKKEA